jgi:hypothetical protein
MGWDAYPMKNGETLKCPIGMHAGCYGEVLARFVPSIYWQPKKTNTPCMSLNEVRFVLNEMDNVSSVTYNTTDAEFNHVRSFLKWCSDNGAGVWFSF